MAVTDKMACEEMLLRGERGRCSSHMDHTVSLTWTAAAAAAIATMFVVASCGRNCSHDLKPPAEAKPEGEKGAH